MDDNVVETIIQLFMTLMDSSIMDEYMTDKKWLPVNIVYS